MKNEKSGALDISGLNRYLFWDVDLQNFDAQYYRNFLAKRIATKGQFSDIKWFFEHFGRKVFIEVVDNDREIPADVKNFWRLYKQHV